MNQKKYGEDKRRIELLKSTGAYLEEVGLLEFSFRGAAKAAGVTPMTLVRYFNNRDGLIDELLEYSMREEIKSLSQRWSMNIQEPVKSMRAVVSDFSSHIYDLKQIECQKLWSQLVSLAGSPNAPISLKKTYSKLYDISLEYLTQVLLTQGLTKEKAKILAVTITSFKNGVLRDYYVHQNKELTKASFDLMLDWLQLELNKVIKT